MLRLVPYKLYNYFLYAIHSAAKTGSGICFPGQNPPKNQLMEEARKVKSD